MGGAHGVCTRTVARFLARRHHDEVYNRCRDGHCPNSGEMGGDAVDAFGAGSHGEVMVHSLQSSPFAVDSVQAPFLQRCSVAV